MHSLKTLVSVADLAGIVTSADVAVVDCRFDLANPEAGYAAYVAGHIPGAVYANLDGDLSGPVVRGRTGRHPLPAIPVIARTLSKMGIDDSIAVVCYDASGGAIAARLWWLLKWLGHESVAVLDGGFEHWRAAGLAVLPGVEWRSERAFVPRMRNDMSVDADRVAHETRLGAVLIDSREEHRFRGDSEPIDSVAGRIPGAVSAPFMLNLTENAVFKSPDDLGARFADVLHGNPAEGAIVYCGSGVTAAHNVLAMEHAGLGRPRLYPGSWSEWIIKRPDEVEVG